MDHTKNDKERVSTYWSVKSADTKNTANRIGNVHSSPLSPLPKRLSFADTPAAFSTIMYNTEVPKQLQKLTFSCLAIKPDEYPTLEEFRTFAAVRNHVTISLYNCLLLDDFSNSPLGRFSNYLTSSNGSRELSVFHSYTSHYEAGSAEDSDALTVFAADREEFIRMRKRVPNNTLSKVVVTASHPGDLYIGLVFAYRSTKLTEVDIAPVWWMVPTDVLMQMVPTICSWFEFPQLKKLSLVVDMTDLPRFRLALNILRQALPSTLRESPLTIRLPGDEYDQPHNYHPALREIEIRLFVMEQADLDAPYLAELLELIKRLTPEMGTGLKRATFRLMSHMTHGSIIWFKPRMILNKLRKPLQMKRNLGHRSEFYCLIDPPYEVYDVFLQNRLPFGVPPPPSVTSNSTSN
ncbi:hypothetical protein K474DRAFT_659171 [Panus rudis PR-1116 ss-1]|nr:hypothetical protein K474DRAFT_659171 [Panus rudis PR-1116 ss-1]